MRAVPSFRIARHADDPHDSEEFRYPFAGAENPKVRLGVVSTAAGAGQEARWFDLTGPFGEDFYLARVDWTPAGAILAQVQSRDQRDLTILRLDPETGAATRLMTERNEAWINLHDILRPLKAGGFLWASEQDGWRHLWVHGDDGSAARRLTSGEWLVEELVKLDEDHGFAYFMGSAAGHLQRHLYRVALDGARRRSEKLLAPSTRPARAAGCGLPKGISRQVC